MFRFVTKKEYWAVENSGILAGVPRPRDWHLKSIQDAVAFSLLHRFRGKHIAEVGGGNSRILPALARHNACCNIEPFEGADGGPQANALPPEIANLRTYLGEHSPVLQPGVFDAVFSVSVLEHVPTPALPAFFQDNRRIMKTGGLCLHLVDIYCAERPSPANTERFAAVKTLFFAAFAPLSETVIGEDELVFRCAYASNPDNLMNAWNAIVPSLRETRETHQSCSLILAGTAKRP